MTGERPSDAYLRAFTEVANRYFDHGPDHALDRAARMVGEFPGRRSSVAHIVATLLAESGRPDEALAVAHDLVEARGWWTTRQCADPSLAGVPGIDAVLARMGPAARAAVGSARTGRIHLHTEVPAGAPRAVVVGLHMRNVPGQEMHLIQEPLAASGFLVVTAESSLLDADGLPCWDEPTIARRDVAAAVDEGRRLAPGTPVVLVGGSQGAGLAIRLAVDPGFPDVAGFVAVVGATPAAELADPQRPGVRGVMIAGGDDRLTSQAQNALYAELDGAGVDVSLDEVPGLPHVFPSDWGIRAPGLLERILPEVPQ